MHRILFPTLGSAGDVYPLITLSSYLQERGHDCTIIANPTFRGPVQAAQINFIPLGSEQQYIDLTTDPLFWQPTRAFGVIVKKGIIPFLQPLLDIFLSFSPKNTLIVSPLLLFAGQIAHQSYGYQFATLQLQPSLLRSKHAPPVLGNTPIPDWMPPNLVSLYYWLLDTILIDPLLAPAINEFRAANNLPPVRRIFQNNLYSDQLNLCLFPEWFAPPQADWPKNTICTGFIAPPETTTTPHADIMNAFLRAGDAPLVFTAGTAAPFAKKFFSVAVQVSSQLGKRAILLTRDGSQLIGQMPNNILHLPFYPLDQLLPQAAAFIHTGGIGSLAQAVAAGIPQLIMPLTNDQPDNAYRVSRLGLGDMLLPRQFTTRNLMVKLDFLLNNHIMLQRCQDYALRVSFDSALKKTADLLEELVAPL